MECSNANNGIKDDPSKEDPKDNPSPFLILSPMLLCWDHSNSVDSLRLIIVAYNQCLLSRLGCSRDHLLLRKGVLRCLIISILLLGLHLVLLLVGWCLIVLRLVYLAHDWLSHYWLTHNWLSNWRLAHAHHLRRHLLGLHRLLKVSIIQNVTIYLLLWRIRRGILVIKFLFCLKKSFFLI